VHNYSLPFRYDADGSGTIDREELGHIVREFDRSATDESIDRIFAEANPDGDLEISFGEFLETMGGAKKEGDHEGGGGSSEFAALGDKVNKNTAPHHATPRDPVPSRLEHANNTGLK